MDTSSDLASNNASEIKKFSTIKFRSDSNNLNSLKTALTKLTSLVNKINSEYVSSSELEKICNNLLQERNLRL